MNPSALSEEKLNRKDASAVKLKVLIEEDLIAAPFHSYIEPYKEPHCLPGCISSLIFAIQRKKILYFTHRKQQQEEE